MKFSVLDNYQNFGEIYLPNFTTS